MSRKIKLKRGGRGKKSGSSRKQGNNKNYISESQIFALFIHGEKEHFTPKNIMRKMKLNSSRDRARIIEILQRLFKTGKIIKTDAGGYVINSDMEIIDGTIEMAGKRKAFLISEQLEKDIPVDVRDLKFALTGDRVKAYSFPNLENPQAEVLSVIERKRTAFVGKIMKKGGTHFLLPEGRGVYFDIFVPAHFIGQAEHNDKVKVEITSYPEQSGSNPEGRVVEIFGKVGENEAEIHSIMAEFELPMKFPRSVLRESERIDDKIPNSEFAKRRDFRNVTTFTIDPVDAKDFDDALSIEEIEEGVYEIGVHIADVTHYVTPGSALEQEAYQRATSVYLVDRVVPMLPERLSNGLCSLRPHEEKLTFSCVFKMTADAELKDVWIGRTAIYSDQRFAYEDAQQRIEDKEGSYQKEVNILNDIALKLRDERYKNGSISFETQEVKFNLDKDGKPINVFVKERKDAHKMIEEFMLLANKKVAEFVYKRSKTKQKDTMVYRVHEAPDQEKLDSFAQFAKRFGYTVNVQKNVSNAINDLAVKTHGKIEHDVLQQLAIRSMSKAKYTTDPLEHFGLGFAHYSHFTSPIRRYPDMMAHRLIEHYLSGGKSADLKEYEEKCRHSSDMERRATSAERLSIKFKQVEYVQQFEGESFDGFVTGMSDFGFYVELGNLKCEGMVRFVDMKDDHYYSDMEKYEIVGRRTKKKILLGQKVRVKVTDTNLERKTIDLNLVK